MERVVGRIKTEIIHLTVKVSEGESIVKREGDE